jgi:sugar phosphate isomerase/epimerase
MNSVATTGINQPLLHITRFVLAVLLAAVFLAAGNDVSAKEIPEQYKVGGFALGSQAYTFNRFSLLEAIEKTAQAGGKVIEFFPGQILDQAQPNVRWDHNASDEMIRKVEEHLKRFQLLAVNYGVVPISKNESEARKVFEFAKRLGLQGITTASEESLDMIEKLVKEYDIRVGFHNHPRRPDDPNYRIWDPAYLRDLVKDRDRRIGACADTGHWIRTGIDPVEALRILDGRIMSMHLKDRVSQSGHDVVFGTGMGNVPGVLEELKRQNFNGTISVEFEFNWDHSVPDVGQCIGFIRGYGMAKGWQ